ncbi:MAG: MBL fold metallo-hydrolase [Kiritimatiellae bacterium]|nr:MBL fold metallo-hydrolase [Kiritimatiellia bacterium]
MRFRFLGTGTSVGVPQIGCDCHVCTSSDPRDRRRRCGAYVTAADGTSFLLDTPPEMRLACVEYRINKVDAVVVTHAHMDHVSGFDDLRRFNTLNGKRIPCEPGDPLYRGLPYRIEGKPLTCYAMSDTILQLHRIFPYISAEGGKNGLFRPMIEFDPSDSFTLGSVVVERLKVEHGFPCCGYLMKEEGERGQEAESGTIAYISDCHELPDETVHRIEGVGTLVLNCLRERPHPTHLSLADALGYIERIRPGRAYLIHMCHDFSHAEWLKRLPAGVEPAYDGLELSV